MKPNFSGTWLLNPERSKHPGRTAKTHAGAHRPYRSISFKPSKPPATARPSACARELDGAISSWSSNPISPASDENSISKTTGLSRQMARPSPWPIATTPSPARLQSSSAHPHEAFLAQRPSK